MKQKTYRVQLYTGDIINKVFVEVTTLDELLAHEFFIDIKNSVGFIQFAKYKTEIYKEFSKDNKLYYSTIANAYNYGNKGFLKALPDTDPTASHYNPHESTAPLPEPKPVWNLRDSKIKELQEEIKEVTDNYEDLNKRVRKMRNLVYRLNKTLAFLLSEESRT